MHIALEGPDGTGKTTVAKILAAKLNGSIYVSEPFIETDEERKIQDTLPDNHETQAAWFHYLRIKLYEKKIKPAKQNNLHIIQDRCYLSTLVYQYLINDDKHGAKRYEQSIPPFIKPNKIYIFTLPTEEAIKRKKEITEEMSQNKYSRLIACYQSFNTIEYRPFIKYIDASQPLETIVETIYNDITNRLRKNESFSP